MALFSHFQTVLGYIFILVLVVFFHELGHFLAGRLCGARIDAFSVGFGPEIAAYTDRKGTRWRLAAIPLGGYVKFHGDSDVSAKPTAIADTVARGDTFAGKSALQRGFVVAAGPIASFLLAIVLFAGLFYVEGIGVLAPRVASVVADSAASQAGFQPGDRITSIDGRPIDSFMDMQRIVSESSDTPLAIDVDRSGTLVHLTATPQRKDVTGPFGTARIGVLGLGASTDRADYSVKRLGPIESVTAATSECWYVVSRTVSYLGGLLTGRETVAQLSGPVRMVEVTDKVVQLGFGALLNLAAFFSVSIGFFNLLPIPPLDGGRLLFCCIEAVQGRPVSERVQEYGFRLGIALVATLMLCATYNDISRFFVS
ncbi:RIP metalloprotease RseP [Lichenihabitans psoromatis]|uniref:RIP metalloprotease RseP n=1 Tax=Lichenihabitans psoromatis TaxID=2528642 RepID=UPI001035E5CC|nr:RIP metalloprotease RseP [Lichenihabitans psoromatis]